MAAAAASWAAAGVRANSKPLLRCAWRLGVNSYKPYEVREVKGQDGEVIAWPEPRQR